MVDLHTYDWVGRMEPAPDYIPTRLLDMTLAERNQRTIEFLSSACMTCTMCELGLTKVERGGISRDPHVFSNLNVSKFMVVVDKVSLIDVEKHFPIVGFDNRFYITPLVKCYSDTPLTSQHVRKCLPYLQIEVETINPQFIVGIGRLVFDTLCDVEYCVGEFVACVFGMKYYQMPDIDHHDFERHLNMVFKLVDRICSK